jgi:hypothetical protein
MDQRLKTKLRIEKSENCSGALLSCNSIPILKEVHYYVRHFELDGDAPKQFIKVYHYSRDSTIRKHNLNSWIPYIAKTAEKWYPHESVIEFMINRIGQTIGLFMNEIMLARVNGQIRFLSKFFRGSSDILIHGAEICGDYLNDRPMAAEIANSRASARELFTFEFIAAAIESVFPTHSRQIINDLVRMVTFDALTGNNDRHFYNWGVIDTLKKGKQTPKFAPIYDSARGLLWNWDIKRIVNAHTHYKKGGKKIANYIEEACPRISIEGNSQVNHFELVKFLKEDVELRNIINNLASAENEQKVLSMLSKEFWKFFSPERRELLSEVIKIRFDRIRNL